MARLNDLLGPIPEALRKDFEPNLQIGGDQVSTVAPQAPDEDPSFCSICHGLGFVRRELPLEHHDFGRALPCRCVELESRETRLSRLQRYSNLGPLTRLTFGNLVSVGRSPNPRHRALFARCVEAAREFAKDPNGWLVLVGPSGSGKTHIAAAVANQCLERGVPAFFVVVPNLLDHLRSAYRPNAEVGYSDLFEQVCAAPVLIMDDLGTESATPWAREKLFQIVNQRFNARLPTVVTTNLPLSKLEDPLRTRLGDPSTLLPHADPIAKVFVLEEHGPLDDWEFNMAALPHTQELTFVNFDLFDNLSERDRQWRERAYQVAMEYAREPVNWLALMGGRERDRTHLLAAITNAQKESGPLLVRVNDLLDYLRHAMKGEGEDDYYVRKRALREHPLLLLDELEIGTGSDYTRREVYDLLYWRQMARLPTVISSPNEMNQLLSDRSWMRLAKLLQVPNFVTEVPAGETPREQESKPSTSPDRLKNARPGARPAQKAR